MMVWFIHLYCSIYVVFCLIFVWYFPDFNIWWRLNPSFLTKMFYKFLWEIKMFFDKINFWLLNEIDVFKQRPLENTDVLFFFDCVEFLNLRHLLSTRSASHDHKLSSVLLCEAFTELLICEKNSEKMNFLQCYTIKYSNISFNIRLCQYSIPFW